MQPFIAGNNGPGVGGPGQSAKRSESAHVLVRLPRLTFRAAEHGSVRSGCDCPINWIHQDLAAAAGVPYLKHTFVMGHKQAFTPADANSEQALDSNPELRNQFWDELNNAGVGYYLVAHAHLWHFSRPASPISLLQHTVQIIAGNGGSKPDPLWVLSGADVYYGFTLVQVLKNGEVVMKSYGRDFDPTNYLAPSPPALFPTTIRRTLNFPVGQ